jgi:hypothetical protein
VRKNGEPYEEPHVLYIGNAMKRAGYNFDRSDWANPYYKLAKTDRERCVALFREYILDNEELMARLPELRGRALGCWCKPRELCHGDVLIELLGERGQRLAPPR